MNTNISTSQAAGEFERPDEATIEREQQRSESEARDIIHDVQRLYSMQEDKKTRWVWELMQNAKDVSLPEGIDIQLILTPEKLQFRHNGQPFRTKHLLAILYKTSTKSLDGEGGTTGKYGTGFVTTHVLNKKLTISGIHENTAGKRGFVLEIDRTPAQLIEEKALTAMQEVLRNTFVAISEIAKSPPAEISDYWNTFTYLLKPDAYVYAEKGLKQLEANLAFLLLINPKINSIAIEFASDKVTYTREDSSTEMANTRFISLGEHTGILYQKNGKLTFGIPAIRNDGIFTLLPIENQAILFKEFPLIGTEGFNLPAFVQHEDFHPTELRDAIRTKFSSGDEQDPVAEQNRICLIDFRDQYLSFIETVINAKIEGSFLFAKSGLPEFTSIFSDPKWYREAIQEPIRNTILNKEVVVTCKGAPKKISEAKFIDRESNHRDVFFDLASQLIPERIPTKNSIWEWADIITQDAEEWPEGIMLTVEELLEIIPAALDLNEISSFEWLRQLYSFLEKCGLGHLGETIAIYPNERGEFCKRDSTALHPHIDDQFKIVSKGLGRPLEKEFLDKRVGPVAGIKAFDLTEFFKVLNQEMIGNLPVESASPDQVKAVFRVCSLFRSDRAFRREEWYSLLAEIVPDFVQEKKTVSVDYENYGRSAEFWSVKYICYLLEKASKPTVLVDSYFDKDAKTCFSWLSRFINFVLGLVEESREVILKKNIIPVQSDEFRSYDDFVFVEEDSRCFTDSIKDLYKDHLQKGDPRRFIADRRLITEGLRRKDVEILTKEIDKLFNDENIESKVKKGGNLNEMFLKLNDWFESYSTSGSFLPTFASKRASLYVLALGEGFSKQIMDIRKSGKTIDDITELAKIQLTVEEMKLLEAAATELGSDKLLEKAKEMLDSKREIERWKSIGKAAEKAFTAALIFTQPAFKILNPDIGKDFVIIANAKEYAIEIKSVDPGKGNVNMSLRQGDTAVLEKDCYALCVITRPADGSEVSQEYFINEARFVPRIGYEIGDSINNWNQGIRDLDTKADVKVDFDDKSESVYISRNIWKNGISFIDFQAILTEYFTDPIIANEGTMA